MTDQIHNTLTEPIQQPGEPETVEATDNVTCPECGWVQTIAPSRRDARDFCARCDFPLFWTPDALARGAAFDVGDASLRRLPGTVGRVAIASRPCPHCSEPNALSAEVCIRCHKPMTVVPEAPPPPPVYEVPPEPPIVVGGVSVPWWPWVVLLLALAVMVSIAVLHLTDTWH